MGFLSRGHIEKYQKPVNFPKVALPLEDFKANRRVATGFIQPQLHPMAQTYSPCQDVANSDRVRAVLIYNGQQDMHESC